MGKATYRLLFVKNGCAHFARVTVSAEFAPECSIAVSEGAHEDERAAARSGAAFALHHIAGREGSVPARVVVEHIETSLLDTRPDDVACATCRAVWQALGVESSTALPWPG